MKKFIRNVEALQAILRGLQMQGKAIVLANGTFDLLHVGHIRYLRDARSRGDFLVVAVNTDRSVRAYKDRLLPIIPQAERVEVLEALSCVDYVTLWNEPTMDDLLLALRPDIHAKGTDYTEKTVPERETVLSFGGTILIVGDKKRHSATDIMKKVKALKRIPKGGPSKVVKVKPKAAPKTKKKKKDTKKKAKKKVTKKASKKAPRKKAVKKKVGARKKTAAKKVSKRKKAPARKPAKKKVLRKKARGKKTRKR